MQKALTDDERTILSTAIKVNGRITSAVCALLGACGLWAVTAILLWRDDPIVGPHLSMLGIFLPGYDVSWTGAWIGFVYGLMFGGITGRIVYWGYARSLQSQLEGFASRPPPSGTEYPVLLLAGPALGLGIGIAIAVPLIVSTNWLVIRGTADKSENAALLQQFLPGYTVSPGGSLIGAIELVAGVFIAAQILSWIYNALAKRRQNDRTKN